MTFPLLEKYFLAQTSGKTLQKPYIKGLKTAPAARQDTDAAGGGNLRGTTLYLSLLKEKRQRLPITEKPPPSLLKIGANNRGTTLHYTLNPSSVTWINAIFYLFQKRSSQVIKNNGMYRLAPSAGSLYHGPPYSLSRSLPVFP